jgi:hypothetical protein
VEQPFIEDQRLGLSTHGGRATRLYHVEQEFGDSACSKVGVPTIGSKRNGKRAFHAKQLASVQDLC